MATVATVNNFAGIVMVTTVKFKTLTGHPVWREPEIMEKNFDPQLLVRVLQLCLVSNLHK